jgi:hypothetical protein
MRLLPLTLIAALALFGCTSKAGNDKENTDQIGSALPETSNKPNQEKTYLYITTVDKLILREAPTTQSKALSKLSEGAFVYGKNEVSENREEIVLRDIPYNKPFYKVTALNNPEQNGWAYGGGLRCIYTGPIEGRPELGPISKLGKFIQSLNSRDLKSGGRLWQFVRQNFKDAEGSLADAVFIQTEGFLRRMDLEGEYYTETETINWTNADFGAIADDKFDMSKYPQTQKLGENGFRLEMAEGYVFPIIDWSKLNDFFGSKCTPPMKIYLDERTQEQIRQEYNDGAIIIPLNELADRAAFWEKFNTQNPDFPLSDETQDSERFSWEILLTGSDNTPAILYDQKKVSPEFRSMWEYTIKAYPGTQLAKRIQAMYDLCASENWKYTPAVEKHLIQVVGYTTIVQ